MVQLFLDPNVGDRALMREMENEPKRDKIYGETQREAEG